MVVTVMYENSILSRGCFHKMRPSYLIFFDKLLLNFPLTQFFGISLKGLRSYRPSNFENASIVQVSNQGRPRALRWWADLL